MLKMLDEKVWAEFVKFFRYKKGYTDWTQQEIENSRNEDDDEEFVEWLINDRDLPFKRGE